MCLRRLPFAGGPLALGLLGMLSLTPVWAAGGAIDPDPYSPTIGEILDREERARVPLPPPRIVRTQPVIPRGAVTVWAPGVRARPGPVR
jgi:hypothetical protein